MLLRPSLFVGVLVGSLCTWTFLQTGSSSPGPNSDNPEVKNIVDADQQDRSPGNGKPIDWKIVGPRDQARLKRIKEVYRANLLRTAHDYANAALVLQHSNEADDYLLAHEMCVVSILKGDHDAAWLAAASEDRFLMNLNRPQRFATQYRSQGTGPLLLYKVDQQLTDAMRIEMHAPTLKQAKEQEKRMMH